MRLFVAVWPPEDVVELLAALPRPERDGRRWTTPEQWHVTLRFLGQVDDPAPIIEALAGTEFPPATAVLGPAVERIGRMVAAVPVAGLDDVAAAVAAATAGLGAPPADRPFRGHVTIARSKRSSLRDAVGAPLGATWPVREVHLVRSHLHPTGSRYETFDTWPCATAP